MLASNHGREIQTTVKVKVCNCIADEQVQLNARELPSITQQTSWRYRDWFQGCDGGQTCDSHRQFCSQTSAPQLGRVVLHLHASRHNLLSQTIPRESFR